ncbi:MAG: hypothetical protein AMJ61_17205 [Desulfobacterales bacterium SG8_35_2]|nr:MAG: hypothetical protein AMJ61_17205 [Desulfobacterales bacterium SG8_35_2]
MREPAIQRHDFFMIPSRYFYLIAPKHNLMAVYHGIEQHLSWVKVTIVVRNVDVLTKKNEPWLKSFRRMKNQLKRNVNLK